MKYFPMIVCAFFGAVLFGVGGSDKSLAGLVVGGLVGYLLVALTQLRRRLATLEQRLKDKDVLEMPLATSVPKPSSPPPVPAEVSKAPPVSPPPVAAPTRGWQEEAGKPRSQWQPPEVALAGPLQWLKEFFTGGNAIVRIGVIVLFFGVAFLLKFAAERGLLPIELRLMGAAVAAIVLLIVGWRLRTRREMYALALQGGGVGILYLTVFVALRLYALLPAPLAFALLVAIAVLSALLAVLQNARSLAVVGAAGGFLAPILASTGGGNHVLLFSYYALLNAGILGISWFRAWRELNLLGFAFTFVIGAWWGQRFYHAELFATTEPFLILFFLFYVAIAVLFAFRQPLALKGAVDGTLVFGVPIVGFALQAVLVRPYEYGLAWSALGAGLFYLSLATRLFRHQPREGRLLTEAFLALGVVFGTLAIPLALDARWTAAAWALEGAAIVWVSTRQTRLLGRVFGALLIIGAGVSFTRSFGAPPGAWVVLNGNYLGCVLIALAALASGWMLTRAYADRREWEGSLALGLLGWGLLWWFGGGLHEIDVYAGNRDKPAWALAFFAASAAVSVWLGTRASWRALRLTALGLLPAGMLIAALSYEWLTHALERFTVLAWLGFFAAHYAILRREEPHAAPAYAQFLHAGALWLITLLGVWELSWAAQEFIQGAATWPLSARGVMLALPILVVLAWSRWPQWPWTRWRLTYLTLGALPLLVVAGLWSFTANWSSSAAATPLDYLPLLNPLDVAQAAVLLAALGWFQAYVAASAGELSAERRQLFWALVGAMVFVWLNAMLLRTLHHWADIPFTLRALTGSMLVQASLSIFWTVLALTLMVTATRRAWRVLWLVGAALLGMVVVKLFLVDLGRTGTIARIVSFLVVGVLLLLIGYFAPVPPRQKKQEVVS